MVGTKISFRQTEQQRRWEPNGKCDEAVEFMHSLHRNGLNHEAIGPQLGEGHVRGALVVQRWSFLAAAAIAAADPQPSEGLLLVSR